MEIIYARMQGYDWVSVPSDAVARELENLGHHVTIVDSLQHIPIREYDVVWSPYESVTLLGDAIAKQLNIPHFAHIEVLPPWRVIPNCDYHNYGLESNDPEIKNFQFTHPYYMEVGEAWKRAKIKTISSKTRIPMHQKLLNITDEIHLRYPSIDITTLDKAKKIYNPPLKDTQILTVARAVPIKRYDLLIQVVNKIKTKAIWTIIGDGPMISKIKEQVINPNITVEFLGSLWGWEKLYHMIGARVFLFAMGAMPALEAAYLGVFPIVIENPPTRDIPDFDKFMLDNLGDSVPICSYNELEVAAECVDEELNTPRGKSLSEWGTVEKFLTGQTNVTPSSVNASNIIKLCERYL